MCRRAATTHPPAIYLLNERGDFRSSGRNSPVTMKDYVGDLYGAYALYVARYPKAFIIGPVILTFILSTGLLQITVKDDLRFLYSPDNAQSRWEYEVHRQFTGDGSNSTILAFAVESSNRSATNLLTKSRADVISRFNDFVLRNATVFLKGREYNFGADICSHMEACTHSNAIVTTFFDSYYSQTPKRDARIRLTYPLMQYFDFKFFLPTHFYGVVVNKTDEINVIDMIHLIYLVPGVDNLSAEDVGQELEDALVKRLNDSDLVEANLQFSVFSLRILSREIRKNTSYTFPYISITIVLLVTFTVGSCMTADWLTSKPIEAFMGVISSGLAIIAAAGLMSYCGVPYISQVTVMPFLALAIGVDDAYVMLGAWQETDRDDPPEKRLSATLREAGSAITVTSFTDVLSFTIGVFSTTPSSSIFCKYVAAAILFDYAFQITFFAGIMVLGGRREQSGKHALYIWRSLEAKQLRKVRRTGYVGPTQQFFGVTYAPFLTSAPVRGLAIALYVIYLSASLYGCSLLRPNLTPSELLVDDSPVKHYLELAETKIWSEGLIGRVYVSAAPDFGADKEALERFWRFVEDLENTPYSMGRNSTQLWLQEFQTYWQYFSDDQSQFYTALKGFLRVAFNSHWNDNLQWAPKPDDPQKSYVNKFYFTTGFQVKDWNARTKLLIEWRNITKSYPEYQALVFDENNFFSDQVLQLPSSTLNSVGIAFITMAAICILFIGNIQVIGWVMFCMLSMDFGVLGIMALTGAELGPTTVVNILMSTGLSIDFVSHMGYSIYRAEHSDPDERIRHALGSIGWPIMQGGLSTLLAVISMLLVKSEVVRLFAQTVILVVVIGMFHGLVLLPVVMRTFTFSSAAPPPKKRNHHVMHSVDSRAPLAIDDILSADR